MKVKNATSRGCYLSVVLAIMQACTPSENQEIAVLDPPLINHIAQPVQLELELTQIPLEEYIDDATRIDSITTNGPFNQQIDNSNILLLGRPQKPLYVLNIWSDGVAENLLLKRTRPILHNFLYIGKANGVKVKGDFNDWNPNLILERNGNAFSDYLLLRPGRYEYLMMVDGREILDPYNKDSVLTDGRWHSVLSISGSDVQKSPIVRVASFSDKSISVSFQKTLGYYVFWQNTLLKSDLVEQTETGIQIEIPSNARTIEQSLIRVWTENVENGSEVLEIELKDGEMLDEEN